MSKRANILLLISGDIPFLYERDELKEWRGYIVI